MGNKRKYEAIESDSLINHQKEAQSVKRWEKVKTQVALLPWWPRGMQKSSKSLKLI